MLQGLGSIMAVGTDLPLQMLQVSVQMETGMIQLQWQGPLLVLILFGFLGFFYSYFYCLDCKHRCRNAGICGGCQGEGEVKPWTSRHFITQTLKEINKQPHPHPHPKTIRIQLHVWGNQGGTKVSIKLQEWNSQPSHVKVTVLSAVSASPPNLILSRPSTSFVIY